MYRSSKLIIDSKLYVCGFRILLFRRFIDLTILLNTIAFALDAYPGDPELEETLRKFNVVFYVIFCLEMALKMLALGLHQYVTATRFNIFDAFIVIVSTVDIIIEYAAKDESLGAVSALRAFRLLRIFKLAQSWKDFQNLLIIIGKTLQDVSNFSILLFLFIFIYTLLGMEMFANQVAFDGNDQPALPRADSNGLLLTDHESLNEQGIAFPDSTFNTWMEAFATVFIVLANDGWSTIYINHYRSTGTLKPSLFFITLLVIGQHIMLNLFLAILISNFYD